MLPWQQHRSHCVSLVMYISGAKFKEHHSDISGDILDSVFNSRFARCRHLPTTTRIPFVLSLLFKFSMPSGL